MVDITSLDSDYNTANKDEMNLSIYRVPHVNAKLTGSLQDQTKPTIYHNNQLGSLSSSKPR